MEEFNAQKEEIDYAKVEKFKKKIAKNVKEIRELYLKEYKQGDYLTITIYKNGISFNNTYYDEDRDFPIDYSEYIETKE